MKRLTLGHGSYLGRSVAFTLATAVFSIAGVCNGSPALADFSSTAVGGGSGGGIGASQQGNGSNNGNSSQNYGQNIGSNDGSQNQQSAASSALPPGANYKIHSGDLLNVQIYGDQSLSQNTSVLPDGSINYPLAGRVLVRGMSTQDAALAITRKLQSFVKHPYVTVSVTTAAQYTILVLGNVKTPGKYFLRSDARLTDAIAASGGLAPVNGNLPPARISLGTSTIEQVSLQKLFHDGDTSQNVSLNDGSVVYIPSPNTFDVEVVGSVDHPGNITLNEGDRLSMAIAKAGNSQTSNADLNHVHITRTDADGKTSNFEVNLYNTLVKGDVKSDVTMKKGDVVYIPISKGGKNGASAGGGALMLLGRLVGLPVF